jgi:hypothetical protein
MKNSIISGISGARGTRPQEVRRGEWQNLMPPSKQFFHNFDAIFGIPFCGYF